MEKLGIDKDDVIVEFAKSMIKWHNKKYKENHGMSDHKVYALEQVWKCTREEALKRIFEFYDSTEFKKMDPTPGAVEALTKLSKKYELHIITSRPDSIHLETKRFIKKYFPMIKIKNIHFGNLIGKHSNPKKKSEILKSLGIKIMIEDHIDYAVDCAENGIKAYLIQRPWNNGPVPKGLPIVRVKNWKELVKKL